MWSQYSGTCLNGLPQPVAEPWQPMAEIPKALTFGAKFMMSLRYQMSLYQMLIWLYLGAE